MHNDWFPYAAAAAVAISIAVVLWLSAFWFSV
jgi:hypothetical protein